VEPIDREPDILLRGQMLAGERSEAQVDLRPR